VLLVDVVAETVVDVLEDVEEVLVLWLVEVLLLVLDVDDDVDWLVELVELEVEVVVPETA
jgi:hypothetical protein